MFCPHCGKEFLAQANFCSACGAGAVPMPMMSTRLPIVRPRHPRMIAGVCSGIAIHYGWDIALVRILFAVFTCLTSGIGIFDYIAAWIIVPDALYALPPGVPYQPAPNMAQRPVV